MVMAAGGTSGGATSGGDSGGSNGSVGANGSAAGGTASGAGSGSGPGAGEAGDGSSGEELGGEGAGLQTPAAYQAKLKYKVMREEKDFPDWAKPFVTSEDLEKNFRDVLERADGLADVKQHRDTLVSENTQMREQWAPFVRDAQEALGHAKRGDLKSFFEKVGIDDTAVLKHALAIMEARENPAAAAESERMRQVQLENQRLQQQLTQTNSGYEQFQVQTRTMQLDSTLARTDTLAAVTAFDARVGKPGSFRAEVIRRGQAYAAMGQDPTVEQVVGEMLQLIGWQGGETPAPAQEVGAAGGDGADGAETPPASAQGKPVLPNLKGKGGSPVKKLPRSTDDIRKLSKQFAS